MNTHMQILLEIRTCICNSYIYIHVAIYEKVCGAESSDYMYVYSSSGVCSTLVP